MTRIFESIGTGKCIVCGTSKEGQAMLIPIDGTQEGNTEQCVPIHVTCLDLRMREIDKHRLLYQQTDVKWIKGKKEKTSQK